MCPHVIFFLQAQSVGHILANFYEYQVNVNTYVQSQWILTMLFVL